MGVLIDFGQAAKPDTCPVTCVESRARLPTSPRTSRPQAPTLPAGPPGAWNSTTHPQPCPWIPSLRRPIGHPGATQWNLTSTATRPSGLHRNHQPPLRYLASTATLPSGLHRNHQPPLRYLTSTATLIHAPSLRSACPRPSCTRAPALLTCLDPAEFALGDRLHGLIPSRLQSRRPTRDCSR